LRWRLIPPTTRVCEGVQWAFRCKLLANKGLRKAERQRNADFSDGNGSLPRLQRLCLQRKRAGQRAPTFRRKCIETRAASRRERDRFAENFGSVLFKRCIGIHPARLVSYRVDSGRPFDGPLPHRESGAKAKRRADVGQAMCSWVLRRRAASGECHSQFVRARQRAERQRKRGRMESAVIRKERVNQTP